MLIMLSVTENGFPFLNGNINKLEISNVPFYKISNNTIAKVNGTVQNSLGAL